MNAKTGKLERGGGGLVSALLGVQLDEPFAWFGFEPNEDSRRELLEKISQVQEDLSLHPVPLDKKIYDSYYDKFCNDVLWPLFHYEGHHVFFRRSDWESYQTANRRMADEILKVAGPGDSVWIHDFHFMLLPEMLKETRPDLKVGFFLHTPFPSSEIFRQLPVREEILRAMTRADLVGFHEHSYLRHFTTSLASQLGLETTFFKADLGDHILHLGVYPISIDIQAMKEKASSPEVTGQCEKLRRKIQSGFLILGVDRLDYAKGLELKLRGFRRLLQKYPELRGQVNLLQVAVPTRTKVPSYIRLKREIDQLVGTINGEFGQPGYVPVNYIFNSVTERDLLALYRLADCILITSKRDGMNLVAMEYLVSQDARHPGTLVLSEFAGAASLLGQAIRINPWDEDSIADALEKAFRMPLEERSERLAGLHEMLSKYSASQWASSFLKDLDSRGAAAKDSPTIKISPDPATWPPALREKVRTAQRCGLLLDYDGTLVPLRPRPEMATASADLLRELKALQGGFEISILSGRSRAFLDEQFPKCGFRLAAEHGAFTKEPGEDWKCQITSDTTSWMNEVRRVMTSYSERVPLSFIETKEAALVWHFRQSPPDFGSFQARKLDEELQTGLANLPVSVSTGSKIVEAKAVECNKGTFTRTLLDANDGETFFIGVGDDRTDEDLFRALSERGFSVKVGSGRTAAACRLADQDQVLPFLRALLKVRKET